MRHTTLQLVAAVFTTLGTLAFAAGPAVCDWRFNVLPDTGQCLHQEMYKTVTTADTDYVETGVETFTTSANTTANVQQYLRASISGWGMSSRLMNHYRSSSRTSASTFTRMETWKRIKRVHHVNYNFTGHDLSDTLVACSNSATEHRPHAFLKFIQKFGLVVPIRLYEGAILSRVTELSSDKASWGFSRQQSLEFAASGWGAKAGVKFESMTHQDGSTVKVRRKVSFVGQGIKHDNTGDAVEAPLQDLVDDTVCNLIDVDYVPIWKVLPEPDRSNFVWHLKLLNLKDFNVARYLTDYADCSSEPYASSSSDIYMTVAPVDTFLY